MLSDWCSSDARTLIRSQSHYLFVAVNTTDVDLYFGARVQLHFVEESTVVVEFRHAPLNNSLVFGIDQTELIRMHADTEIVLLDEIAHASKSSGEVLGPVDGADGMAGERNGLRGNAEEIEAVLSVVFQQFLEAREILFGHFETLVIAVLCETKDVIGSAQARAYAWIADLHAGRGEKFRCVPQCGEFILARRCGRIRRFDVCWFAFYRRLFFFDGDEWSLRSNLLRDGLHEYLGYSVTAATHVNAVLREMRGEKKRKI